MLFIQYAFKCFLSQQARRGVRLTLLNYIFMSETKKASSVGLLSKYVKKAKLVITSVVDDSSEENSTAKLELEEPVTTTGSQVTAETGTPIGVTNATICYINGSIAAVEDGTDTESDLAQFMKHVREEDGKLVYEGPLKFDVSRPKFAFRNGVASVLSPAKLWLVSVAFNKRGIALRRERITSIAAEVQKLMGGPAAAPAAATKPATEPKVVQ